MKFDLIYDIINVVPYRVRKWANLIPTLSIRESDTPNVAYTPPTLYESVRGNIKQSGGHPPAGAGFKFARTTARWGNNKFSLIKLSRFLRGSFFVI